MPEQGERDPDELTEPEPIKPAALPPLPKPKPPVTGPGAPPSMRGPGAPPSMRGPAPEKKSLPPLPKPKLPQAKPQAAPPLPAPPKPAAPKPAAPKPPVPKPPVPAAKPPVPAKPPLPVAKPAPPKPAPPKPAPPMPSSPAPASAPAPAPAPASAPAPAAAAGVGESTGLTPSPEYIAAREAALAAIRAEKEQGPPSAEDVEASYAASMAVLDEMDAPAPAPAPAPRAPIYPSFEDEDDDGLMDIAPSTAPGGEAARGRRHSTVAARRKAMSRIAISGRTGQVVPAEINGPRLVIGLVIAAAGLALILWYFPTRGPDAPSGAEVGYAWRFSSSLYLKAQIVAGALTAIGVMMAFMGLRFRPEVEAVCKKCRKYVMSERDGVILRCPRSPNHTRFDRVTIGLIAGVLFCLAAIVVCISMASIVRG